MAAEAHFVEVGPHFARSDRGFEVRFLGRFELGYSEGSRSMVIPLDRVEEGILIELSRAEGWQAPFADEALDAGARQRIADNLSAAMKRMRLGFALG